VVGSWCSGDFYTGLPSKDIPIILINPEGKQSASSYLPTIAVDGVMGGRIAGEHLIGLGHKRIAYVGRGPVGELQRARLQGLREAFADAGLKFDPSLVVSEGRGGKAGYLGVRRLLSQGNLPSAIFCYHDLSAYGAMEALKEAGLRVPDDVSVVGFDDIFMSRYVSLTTLAQPFADMGRLAAQVILERLTNQMRIADIRVIPELVVRESTAACRPGDAPPSGFERTSVQGNGGDGLENL
jgi:DNA-binding LacI/PurR family transcriptional regulator